MSCSRKVLSTKTVLLDHIFAVVKPLAPGYAEKIVGMLADSTESQLMTILGNETLLKQTVDKALDCLKSHQEVNCDDTDEKMIIGDELFSIVAERDPALCAQITGMLMEMDVNCLRHLLVDREALFVAIDKAKHEYEKQLQQHAKCLLPDDVAARLYEAVAKVYYKNAAKITGMLAELSEDNVCLILKSPAKLKHMIQMCRNALEETDQWVTE